MPVLANIQHEQFAQALARGLEQVPALLAAGYEDSASAASRASQLWSLKEIKVRYAEIRQEMKAAAQAKSLEDAQTSPGDLTREWMIAEYKKNIVVARDAGKPGDANKALQDIGRLLGFFDDPVAPPGDGKKPGEVPGTTEPVPAFDPSKLKALHQHVADEGDEE